MSQRTKKKIRYGKHSASENLLLKLGKTRKVNSTEQLINKLPTPPTVGKKQSFFLRKLVKKVILLISIIIGVISSLIYFLYDSSDAKFSITISKFSAVDFREVYRNDHPTSPLCGCLNDSVPHDGTMIPAQYCKITDNLTDKRFSNFLITCPNESELGAHACYSFNSKVYRFSAFKYQDMDISELSSLIETDHSLKELREYNNNSFISIITSKNIEIYSPDPESILAFIGSAKGLTSVQKVVDKYQGVLNNVNIKNTNDSGQRDSTHKSPAIDFHSKKIYIKWVDSLNLLTEKGLSTTFFDFEESFKRHKKQPVKQSYKDIIVNVAVIEPKNDIRVSFLPWSDETYQEWKADYFRQFPEGHEYLFFMNIPMIDTRNLAVPHFDSIKPFRTPNFLSIKNDINIEIKKFMKDDVYDKLQEKYARQGGYYYKYSKDDYEYLRTIDVTHAVNNPNFERQLLARRKITDPHLLLQKQKQLLSEVDMKKAKKTESKKVMLHSGSEYFRYPPLHKEEGLSFYNKFSFARLANCDAFVQVDNIKLNIHNQILELDSLKNIQYDYPSLFTRMDDNSKDFRIKGVGKIKVDGQAVSENFFEKRTVVILGTITTLLGFIFSVSIWLYSLFNYDRYQ